MTQTFADAETLHRARALGEKSRDALHFASLELFSPEREWMWYYMLGRWGRKTTEAKLRELERRDLLHLGAEPHGAVLTEEGARLHSVLKRGKIRVGGECPAPSEASGFDSAVSR